MAPDLHALWPCHRLRFWILALAIAPLILLWSLRALSDDTPAAGAIGSASASPDGVPAEITGSGTVIDAETGQGVPGAKVTLWEYDYDRGGGRVTPNYFRHHECLTHAEGKFEFTIPTDHVIKAANGTFVRLAIDVKHPDYLLPLIPLAGATLQVTASPAAAAKGLAAAPDRGLPIGLVSGVQLPPIKVVAGKAVTGVLESRDGKPVAGVRIFAFSSARTRIDVSVNRGGRSITLEPTAGAAPPDRFVELQDDTTTDDQGRFRLVASATGESLL